MHSINWRWGERGGEREREREKSRSWPKWNSLFRLASKARDMLVIPLPSSSPKNGDLAKKKPRLNLSPSPSISPEFGHTTGWVLLLTSLASISNQPCHLKQSFWSWTTAGKLTAFEARSATITERGSSWPPPVDSAWLELSDLSSSSPLTEVRSSLTGRGNSIISQDFGVNL